jgi:hypothetical protein
LETIWQNDSVWYEASLDVALDGTIHVVFCVNTSLTTGAIFYGTWMADEGWHIDDNPIHYGRPIHLQVEVRSDGWRDILVEYPHPWVELLYWSEGTRRTDPCWKAWHFSDDNKFNQNVFLAYNSRDIRLIFGQAYAGSRIYRPAYQATTELGSLRYDVMGNGSHQGYHPSIAVDATDRFHLAYFDYRRGMLVYATDSLRPTEPQNVVAEPGEIYVNLTWDPPLYIGSDSAVTYNIYRSSSPNVVPKLVAKEWQGNEFQDNGDPQRNKYYYWIAAMNSAGEGDVAGPVGAVTPTRFPTKPINLTAEAGKDHVLLRWEPPADNGSREITGYVIVWGKGRGWGWMGPEYPTHYTVEKNITRFGTDTFYNHTDRILGTTYRYQVVPKCKDGLGEPSDTVYATPMESPGAPTNLSFRRSPGLIKLSWTRPEYDGGCRIMAYRVYRGTTPDSLELITTVHGRAGDWSLWSEPLLNIDDDGNLGPDLYHGIYSPEPEDRPDPTIEDELTYYYQVSAVNPAGESERSEVLEVKAVGAPGPPRDVRVVREWNGARVTWTDPLDDGFARITEYYVFRLSQGGSWELIGRVSSEKGTFLDKDVDMQLDNWYVVRAVNQMGIGDSSEEVFLEGLDGEAPPAREPEPEGRSPWWWLPLPLIAAVLAIVLARVLVRRGREELRE